MHGFIVFSIAATTISFDSMEKLSAIFYTCHNFCLLEPVVGAWWPLAYVCVCERERDRVSEPMKMSWLCECTTCIFILMCATSLGNLIRSCVDVCKSHSIYTRNAYLRLHWRVINLFVANENGNYNFQRNGDAHNNHNVFNAEMQFLRMSTICQK